VKKTEDRKKVCGLIKGKVLFDAPMRRYTSMKVGGPVDTFLFPKDLEDLREIITYAKERSVRTMIVGNGTNLIVRDHGVRGWLISLTQGLKKVELRGKVVEAEAGLSLKRLVQWSIQKGLTGFEPFIGIPGTVGGGLAMNAGAWGAEMKDHLLAVTFMKEDGTIVDVPSPRLRFSYRGLKIPGSWIILKGQFQAERGKRSEILKRVEFYSEMRKQSQPLDYPSAGSIFKNPKEGPAGKLIEEAGLKGHRIGQAMVSNRHANFIVNLGDAKAEEVIHLMEWVEKKVREVKGISLEREVKVVGD
jgi:UDP-N-acetylmuramate dehydrogenase